VPVKDLPQILKAGSIPDPSGAEHDPFPGASETLPSLALPRQEDAADNSDNSSARHASRAVPARGADLPRRKGRMSLVRGGQWRQFLPGFGSTSVMGLRWAGPVNPSSKPRHGSIQERCATGGAPLEPDQDAVHSRAACGTWTLKIISQGKKVKGEKDGREENQRHTGSGRHFGPTDSDRSRLRPIHFSSDRTANEPNPFLKTIPATARPT